jgi:acyl-coenzyme A thioesterase PaaI-like protein
MSWKAKDLFSFRTGERLVVEARFASCGILSPMDSAAEPKGELVIRTIAMPADTNPNGNIFGGWIMSQMDLGNGIIAAKTTKTHVVQRMVGRRW